MPEDIRSTISFGKSHMHYIKKKEPRRTPFFDAAADFTDGISL